MGPAPRVKTRTSVEIIFEDDAPAWLSHLQFTRDGHKIRISVVKMNGSSYQVEPLCLAEFSKLVDTLLDP